MSFDFASYLTFDIAQTSLNEILTWELSRLLQRRVAPDQGPAWESSRGVRVLQDILMVDAVDTYLPHCVWAQRVMPL